MSKQEMAARIARDIADALFTCGTGKKADRLVLFGEPDRPLQYDLGGWAEKPMADAIEKILVEYFPASAADGGNGK